LPSSLTPPNDPDITIQALPFTSEACVASSIGPFTVLRFEEAPGLGIVHLPGPAGGICLENPAEVTRYQKAFTQAQGSALTPGASVELLRQMAKD
jgi:hypothetical protein